MSIFWCKHALRILQRVEFALARGNGDFLRAQFRLRLPASWLASSVCSLCNAPLRRLISLTCFLQCAERRLQFGDLIFASENGRRALCPLSVAQSPPVKTPMTIEQLAAERDKIEMRHWSRARLPSPIARSGTMKVEPEQTRGAAD